MSIAFVVSLMFAADPPKRGAVVVSPEALKLHRESLVCDGHNDLPWELRDQKKSALDAIRACAPR